MSEKTYHLGPDEATSPSLPPPPPPSNTLWRRAVAYWKAPKSKNREYIETFVIAVSLALFVRATVAEARFIPSESMLPTLEVGDRLIVEKLTYLFAPIERGDIVVFTPPPRAMSNGNAFIKRVVGLPGETIDIRDGRVFIDGRLLKEPYILEAPRYPDPDWERLGMPEGRIPSDAVFVMGDNRNNSQDSHVWGALPIRNVIGQTVFRFWPFPRLGPIAS
ncbi:MAG: signal peptidase I [Candidatus Sericytochromatia bacterium]|nr:signal peptidase I [Candidatus Sericytochromatia bacterium]